MPIADLIVPFKIDDKSAAGIASARRRMAALERQGRRAFSALAGTAGLAAGGVAAIGAAAVIATKQWSSGVKELTLMANTAGVTVKSFSALNYAFKSTGADANDTASIINELQIKLFDASNGVEGVTDAFNQLGRTWQELADSPPDVALRAVADELAAIEDATLRIGIADTLFGGDDAKKILAIVDSLDALEAEAHQLGVTLDDHAAEAAWQFEKAWGRVSGTISGIINDIMPTLSTWLAAIGNAVAYGWQKLWEWGQQWIDTGSTSSWIMALMGDDMTAVSTKAAAMVLAFEHAGWGIVQAFAPVIATFAAIADAGAAMFQGDWGNVIPSLSRAPKIADLISKRANFAINDATRLGVIEAEILKLFPNINEPFAGADLRVPTAPSRPGYAGSSGGRVGASTGSAKSEPFTGPPPIFSRDPIADAVAAIESDSGAISSARASYGYSGGGGGGRSLSGGIHITNIFQLAYRDDDIIDAVVRATEQNVLQIAGAV